MTTIHALPKEVMAVMLSYLPPWEVRAMSRHQPKPEDAAVFACVRECFVKCDALWNGWVEGYRIPNRAKSLKINVTMHFQSVVEACYPGDLELEDPHPFEKYRYLCANVCTLIGEPILHHFQIHIRNDQEGRAKFLKALIAARNVSMMRLLLDGIIHEEFEVEGDLARFREQILAAANAAGSPYRELFYDQRDLQSRAVIEEVPEPVVHPSAANGRLWAPVVVVLPPPPEPTGPCGGCVVT